MITIPRTEFSYLTYLTERYGRVAKCPDGHINRKASCYTKRVPNLLLSDDVLETARLLRKLSHKKRPGSAKIGASDNDCHVFRYLRKAMASFATVVLSGLLFPFRLAQ